MNAGIVVLTKRWGEAKIAEPDREAAIMEVPKMLFKRSI
jgi:hypothetical protein